MIRAKFFTADDMITGFEISGHSFSGESGTDIICAAVSSAAYMAANTITEILNLKAGIEVKDGYMYFILEDYVGAQTVLKGLRLHLEALADDYSKNIKVTSIRRCQNA